MYATDNDEIIPTLNNPFKDTDGNLTPTWVDTLIYTGHITSRQGTMNCPEMPTNPGRPMSEAPTPGSTPSSYKEIYGSWYLTDTHFPKIAVASTAGGTFKGISLKGLKQSSRFIVLADTYSNHANYKSQFYMLGYSSADHMLAHAKHQDRINVAFAAGNVSPVLPGEYYALFNEVIMGTVTFMIFVTMIKI